MFGGAHEKLKAIDPSPLSRRELYTLISDLERRAKRRMLGIQYAKNKKQRKQHYLDLLKVTRHTVGYAQNCIDILQYHFDNVAEALSEVEICRFMDGHLIE